MISASFLILKTMVIINILGCHYLLYFGIMGFKFFSSSKLQHGEGVAQVGSNFYKLDHGKIFKTNALGVINLDAGNQVTNEAPLDFSVTKGVFSMLLIAFLMFFLFSRLAKSYLKNGGVPFNTEKA